MNISTSPEQMMKRDSPGSPERKIVSPAGRDTGVRRAARSLRSSALRNSKSSIPSGSLMSLINAELPFLVLSLHLFGDVVEAFGDQVRLFTSGIRSESEHAIAHSFANDRRCQPARFLEAFTELRVNGDAPANIGAGVLLQEQ